MSDLNHSRMPSPIPHRRPPSSAMARSMIASSSVWSFPAGAEVVEVDIGHVVDPVTFYVYSRDTPSNFIEMEEELKKRVRNLEVHFRIRRSVIFCVIETSPPFPALAVRHQEQEPQRHHRRLLEHRASRVREGEGRGSLQGDVLWPHQGVHFHGEGLDSHTKLIR